MGYTIGKDARCAVIGHGSWATALVKILLENKPQVAWYVRNLEALSHIATHGTNPKYLRDVHFDVSKLSLTDDINEAVRDADVVVLAVPSAFLKSALSSLTLPLEDKYVVSAIKGIVPDDYVTVAEYINARYGVPMTQVGIVAGPCHAEEVALERLSYLTMVGGSAENAATLGDMFRTDYIKVSCSTDVLGTEYASVLKNIYAIAVGIATGLGYGDNFMAVLISNSAMEMDRFLGQAFPGERNTDASAYLGDLLVTSYSQFSRNRTFGVMVGKGYSVKSIQAEMNMVAEGYYASECIRGVKTIHDIDMPIAEAVHRILYDGAPAAEIIRELTYKLI